MIKKYKHRDGFDGNLDHVEWDGVCVIMVYRDGSRKPAPHHDATDVRSFVDMGWWVELPETYIPLQLYKEYVPEGEPVKFKTRYEQT